jgi:hypothetical protein
VQRFARLRHFPSPHFSQSTSGTAAPREVLSVPRRGTPSARRIPKEQAEEILSLYRDQYFDLNVRHFHEKLREDHQIGLSRSG